MQICSVTPFIHVFPPAPWSPALPTLLGHVLLDSFFLQGICGVFCPRLLMTHLHLSHCSPPYHSTAIMSIQDIFSLGLKSLQQNLLQTQCTVRATKEYIHHVSCPLHKSLFYLGKKMHHKGALRRNKAQRSDVVSPDHSQPSALCAPAEGGIFIAETRAPPVLRFRCWSCPVHFSAGWDTAAAGHSYERGQKQPEEVERLLRAGQGARCFLQKNTKSLPTGFVSQQRALL